MSYAGRFSAYLPRTGRLPGTLPTGRTMSKLRIFTKAFRVMEVTDLMAFCLWFSTAHSLYTLQCQATKTPSNQQSTPTTKNKKPEYAVHKFSRIHDEARASPKRELWRIVPSPLQRPGNMSALGSSGWLQPRCRASGFYLPGR